MFRPPGCRVQGAVGLIEHRRPSPWHTWHIGSLLVIGRWDVGGDVRNVTGRKRCQDSLVQFVVFDIAGATKAV